MNNPLKRLAGRFAKRVAFELVQQASGQAFEAELHQAWQDSEGRYAAIARLARRYGYAEDLSAAEVRVFSQNGEDGVLAEIFARVGVESSFFVEFGVEDGVECNTRFLAEVLGWSGVYFEANAETFESLARRLQNREDIRTIQSLVSPENVNRAFTAAQVPQEFDLLCIDIDGQDYWVWEALRDYQPRVVVIEYNSGLSATERLVEPKGYRWQRSDFFGASLGALVSLADTKGYRLVHTELAGVNAFFVRNDLAERLHYRPLYRGPNYELRGRKHLPNGDDSSYVSV